MSKKQFVIVTLALLIVLAMPLAVFAQGTSSTNPQDQPTSVLHAFDNATSAWIQTMHGYANRLFFYLAGIDVVWLGILLVLEQSDMQQTLAKVIKKVITIGFFLSLLQYGDVWTKAIIDSFSQIGVAAAGLPGGVTPSEILFTGVQISSQIFTSFSFSLTGLLAATISPGAGAAIGLLSLFCGVCIFLGYAIISITFIMAKIESYVVLGAGYIFLGFGGSRWTTNYVERYLSLAVASGTRLMVLYLLIGLGQKLGQGWVTMAQNAGNWQHPEENLLGLVAGVFTFMAVCWAAPKFISGIISGSISTGAAELLAPAAAIGAGAATAAAAVVTGGAALAGAAPALANLFGGGGTLAAATEVAPATEAAAASAVAPPWSSVGGSLSGAGGGSSMGNPGGMHASPMADGVAGGSTESAASESSPPGDNGPSSNSSEKSSFASDSLTPTESGTSLAKNADDTGSALQPQSEATHSASGDVPAINSVSYGPAYSNADTNGEKKNREASVQRGPDTISASATAVGTSASVDSVSQETTSNAASGYVPPPSNDVPSDSSQVNQADISGKKEPESAKKPEKQNPKVKVLEDAAKAIKSGRDEAQSLIQHLPQHETSGSAPQLHINHGE